MCRKCFKQMFQATFQVNVSNPSATRGTPNRLQPACVRLFNVVQVAPCHKLECHETGGQRSGSARGDNLYHGNGYQTLASQEVSTQTQSELASSRFASTRTRQGTYHATLELVRSPQLIPDSLSTRPHARLVD